MSNSPAPFNKKSKAAQELTQHRVVCGPVSINASAPCRRRLRDTFDKLLDKLCEKCHDQMLEPEIPDGHEVDENGKVMNSQYLKEQEKAKNEPTLEDKRGKMLDEGRMKNEVQAELSKHKDEVMPKEPEPKKPTLEQRRKEMLDEAKMKAEVKVKAKEHEVRLQGNSKLLQRSDGKIEKR
jgi:hypothetical protein